MASNLKRKLQFSSSEETDTCEEVGENSNLKLYLSDSDDNEKKKVKVESVENNLEIVKKEENDSDVEIVGVVPGDEAADDDVVVVQEADSSSNRATSSNGSGPARANAPGGGSVAAQQSVMVEVRSNRNGSVWANAKPYLVSSDDELPDLVTLEEDSPNQLGNAEARKLYDSIWYG